MKKYRFRILVGTILLLLLVYPFLGHFGLNGLAYLMDAFISLILLSSIQAVSENRGQLILSLLFIVPAIVLGWGDQFLQIQISAVGARIMQITAFSFVGYRLLGYALREGRVDTEKIAAAVAVYLIIGVIWQGVYLLIDVLIPASYNTALLTETEFLYYSFITLSTLGYGDITPVNGPAQALAYMEALIGQLYLTILVARLVGLHIAYTGPDCTGDQLE